MLRRVLSVLLSVALFCALFSGTMAQEKKEIEQQGNEISSGQEYQTASELERAESKYIDKFIVKYPGTRAKASNKLENTAANAFEGAKVKKQAKRDAVGGMNRPKDLIPKNETSKAKPSEEEKPDVSIKEWRGEYKVIELAEEIEPEEYINQMKAELGEGLEYIQPDYKLELSSSDVITINLDLGNEENVKGTSQESDSTVQSIQNSQVNPEVLPYSIDADMQAAWTFSTGVGATVAIIDTGVDVTHPDLVGRMINGYDFVNDTTEVYNSDLAMEQLHGTHVAGIVAKTAPSAQIMPLKCFENGRAYTSDLVEAIEYARQNGATIVNCSWGSSDNNQVLREAIQNSGMLFVCAAGNNRINIDETLIYPAAFELDNIISVSSLNDDLGYSYFSNYGTSNVDVAVLGRDVSSTVPGGSYGTMSGTSMAAGYVSGAAALVSALGEPNVKARLKNTAYRLSNLQNKVNDGDKLGIYNAVSNTVTNDIIQVNPVDDFDVLGYQPTPEENWALFNSTENAQVAAGFLHSIARKSDGTVWAWGHNGFGQLGTGNFQSSAVPVRIVGLTNVISIAAGDGFSIALRDDGTVWAWGFNAYNALGNGTYTDSNVPVQVYGLTDVSSISSGGVHSMALKTDGSVVAWGNNFLGELGDGTYNERTVPVSVSGLTQGVTAISAGYAYSMALKSNGLVFIWGDNELGQAGDGTYNFYSTPTQISTLTEITAISAGVSHTMALKNGTVWTAGGNDGGLGDGSTLSRNVFLPANIVNVVSIWAGAASSFFEKSDGTIWGCGENNHGQLCDSTTENKYEPTITGLTNIDQISMGFNHGLALTNDHSILSWGSNLSGQLGGNFGSQSSTPCVVAPFGNNIPPANDASLSSLSYTQDGVAVAIPIVSGKTTYDINLISSQIPTIDVTLASPYAQISGLTQPSSVPGSATFTITSEDGTTSVNYTVTFHYVSISDNTLSQLSYSFIGETASISLISDDINSNLQENRYSITLPYTTKALPVEKLPVITALPTVSEASVSITQMTVFPGTAKITVTSMNGTIRNYYVYFKYQHGNVVGAVTNKVGTSTYKVFSDLRPLSLAELRELYLESGSNWENYSRAYVDRGLSTTSGVSTSVSTGSIPAAGLISPEPQYINKWSDPIASGGLNQQWFLMWLGNGTKTGDTSPFFNGTSWIATGNNDKATDYMKSNNNDAISFNVDRGATIWVATKGGASANFNNNGWTYNTNSGYAIRHGDGDSFTAYYTKHFDAGTVNIPTYGGSGAGSRMYMPIIVWDAPGTGDTSLSSMNVTYGGTQHNIPVVSGQNTYNVKVESVPVLSATLTDSVASMTITQATELPGSATITVASGTNVVNYTINFTAFGQDIVYADKNNTTGVSGVAYVKNNSSYPLSPTVENVSDPNLLNAGTTFWNFGDGNGDVNISRSYTNYGGSVVYLRNEGSGGGSSQSVYVKMDLSTMDASRSIQQAILSSNLIGGGTMNYNGTNKSLFVEIYEVPETQWITGTGTHDAAWAGLAPNMTIGTSLELFPLVNKSNTVISGDVSTPYKLTWMGAPDNKVSIIPTIQNNAYEKKLTTVYVGQMAAGADYGMISADVTGSVRDKITAGKTTATFKLKITPFIYGYEVPANARNDMQIQLVSAGDKRPKLEVASTVSGSYSSAEKKLGYITVGNKATYTSGNIAYAPGKTPIDLAAGFNADTTEDQIFNITSADLIDGKVYLNAYAKNASSTVSINGAVGEPDSQSAQLIPVQGIANAQIVVTAPNGLSMTYHLTFNLSDYSRSSDASLKSLSYTHPELGKQSISIVPDTTEYNIELPFGFSGAIPQMAAEKNNFNATLQPIVQANQIPGDAAISVIAEDGTEAVYAIHFTISQIPALLGPGTVTNLKYRGGEPGGDFAAVNGVYATNAIDILGDNISYPTQADKVTAATNPSINLYKNNDFRLYADRNSETGGGNGSNINALIGSQMEFSYLNTTSSRFLDERVTKILTMNNEKSNVDWIPNAYSFTIDKPATIYIAAQSKTLTNIMNHGWILDNTGLSISRAAVSGLQYTLGDNLYYAIPNGNSSTYSGIYTKHYASGANVEIPSAGAALTSGMVVLIIWDTASTVTYPITQLSLNTPEALQQTYGTTESVYFEALAAPYYGVDFDTIEWYVNGAKQAGTGATFSYIPINAGEYVVTTKVTNNVNAITDSKTITVSKANQSVSWPAPVVTYSPDLNLSDIPLEQGLAWEDSDTALSAPGGNYTVVYTPTDTINYNTLSQTIPVVVNKADPVITWPIPESVAYIVGLKLSDIPLDTGFSWVYPNTLVSVPGGNYPAIYTPADSMNYNAITKDIPIKVSNKIVSLSYNSIVEFELEDAISVPYSNGSSFAYYDVVDLADTSGGKAVVATCGNPPDDKFTSPESVSTPPLSVTVNSTYSGGCSVWLRVRVENDREDSFWYSINSNYYNLYDFNSNGVTPEPYKWKWISFSAGLNYGQNTIDFCPRESNCLFDKMIITTDFNYEPQDISYIGHRVFEMESVASTPIGDSGTTAVYNTVFDATASGFRAYQATVWGQNSTISFPVNTQASSLAYTVSVAEEQNYSIWVRAKVNSINQDSIWARFDGDNYLNCQLSSNTDEDQNQWKWTKIFDKTLTSGEHVLAFIPNEGGGVFDKVVVSNKADYIPTDSMLNGYAVFEMEESNIDPYAGEGITATFEKTGNFLASGGEVIKAQITSGSGSTLNSVSEDASPVVQYSFDVDVEDNYNIFIRASANNESQDSVWMSIDNKPYENTHIDYNNIPELQGSFGYTVAKNIRLLPGAHTIKIIPRENNGQYDKLIITNDMSYTPSNIFLNGHVVLEAETGSITPYNNGTGASSTYTVVDDATASSGKALQASTVGSPNEFLQPVLAYDLPIEEYKEYSVWVRAKVNNESQNSLYVKLSQDNIGSDYELYQLNCNDEDSQDQWKWTKLCEQVLYVGYNKLEIIPIESGCKIDKFVISSNPEYIPLDTMLNGYATFEMESSEITPYATSNFAATFENVSNSEASDGRMLVAKRMPIGSSYLESVDSNVTPVLKYNLDVDRPGSYDLYIRAIINNDAENSIWMAVDNKPYETKHLSVNLAENEDAFEYKYIGSLDLTAGLHVLKILPREWNGKFDKITIAKKGSSHNFMLNGYYEAELEQGILTPFQYGSSQSSFAIQNNNRASGGKVLQANVAWWGSNSIEYVTTPTLKVDFDIDQPDNYAVWIRTLINNGQQNQVWGKINNEAYSLITLPYNGPEQQNTWQWTKIYTKEFTAGTHTIGFVPNKSGGLFDKVIVTDDMNFVPKGIFDSSKGFENATVINSPTVINGIIDEMGMEEYFVFTPKLSGDYSFNLGLNDNVNVYLYSKVGETYTLLSSSENNAEKMVMSQMAAGNSYYIKIKHISDVGIGTYTLDGRGRAEEIIGSATFNVTNGQPVVLKTTATGINSLRTRFELSYQGPVTLEDIALHRPDILIEPGMFDDFIVKDVALGTNHGTVVFEINRDIPADRTWSGLLSMFKFHAIGDGQVTITLKNI